MEVASSSGDALLKPAVRPALQNRQLSSLMPCEREGGGEGLQRRLPPPAHLLLKRRTHISATHVPTAEAQEPANTKPLLITQLRTL